MCKSPPKYGLLVVVVVVVVLLLLGYPRVLAPPVGILRVVVCRVFKFQSSYCDALVVAAVAELKPGCLLVVADELAVGLPG